MKYIRQLYNYCIRRTNMHATRAVLLALPLLLVPILYGSVYSSISDFEACAVPKAYPVDQCYKQVTQGQPETM
jgi:hypothetical protein